MNEKPTYEELEESVNELEKIFNMSVDMIGSGNLNGYFTKINSSFKQILGYTEREVLEKPFIKFVHDEDIQITEKALIDAATGKQTIFIENRYKCKDASYKWISWSVFSETNKNRFFAVGKEITKQKQAEEVLRNSEAKYRLLSDNVTDVIWIVDMDMSYSYISPSVNRLMGFTAEEVLAMAPEDTMTPDSFEKIMKITAEELEMNNQGQRPVDRSRKFEIEVYRKDGTTVWAEAQGNFLYDSNGQPKGIIGSTRDITERKQAEKVLRESEVKHKTLVNNIPGMAYRAYPDWSAEVFSGSGAVSGYTQEEINSQVNKWLDIIHPDDKKRVIKDASKLVNS